MVNQIKKKLTDFKIFVESVEDQRKDIIRAGLKEIFAAETPTDLDIADAIRKWYNDDLDQYQKDPFAEYHNNDSKPLIKKISGISDQSEFIFKTLPELFGLEWFVRWRSDKTTDFLNKIKAGKKTIEENSTPIGEVKFEIKGEIEKDDSNIRHKGGFEIQVNPENEKDFIYYTEDGSDPSNEKSQRKQIKKGEKIPVYGNKTIKFVVKDPTGKYGKVKSYTTIDEGEKCKIQRTHSKFLGDEKVTFIFPNDEKDVEVAMKSLISEIISANIITKKQLELIVNDILKNIKV